MLTQLLMTYCVPGQERLIHQFPVKQDMHHTQSKCCVRSRIQRNEPIGPISGPVAVNIDYNQLRPSLPGFFDNRNHMHVRTYNIAAPYNEQFGFRSILWNRSSAEPHRVLEPRITCSITNPLLELG
ncbi:hypothetical protein D3C87_576540 [compost metagenome]